MRWASFFLRRPVAALMLNLALVCAGLFSFTRLEVNSMPEVDIPVVTISIALEGASPTLIQSGISKPVEDAVAVISGVDTITSTSSPGFSQTVITFELSKSANEAIQDCRDKVDTISNNFPTGTDKPIYGSFSSNDKPAAQITVSSDSRSLNELTVLTNNSIVDPLQSVSGVAQVDLYGDQKRQINISLDAEKLQEHKTTADDVTTAIIEANEQVPGGLITSPFQESSLQVQGQLKSVEEFGQVVVRNLRNAISGQEAAFTFQTPLRVNELAHVIDSQAELRSLARLNAKPTLTLSVKKTSSANLVKLVGNLEDKVTTLRGTLPADVTLEIVQDGAGPIKSSLNGLKEHLILGSILACLVVLVFLRSFRLTIIAAVAIPISLIATFAVMDALGYTLNTMTLLALTLAVGLVIDDAIVVLENTYKLMEEEGLEPLEAASRSLEEIGSAVVATTFSLAILFLPLSIMPGEVGLYFRSWGVVMAATVLISMVVSFSLTPVMCAKFLKKPDGPTEVTWLDKKLQSGYVWVLEKALRWRFVVVIVSLAALVAAVPLAGHVGKEFIAKTDRGDYNVSLTFPQGWPPNRIAEALGPVEESILKLPHVVDVLTTVDSSDITSASLYVKLAPYAERKPYTQFDSIDDARTILGSFASLKPAVGDTAQKDFSYPILGHDPEILDTLAKQLAEKLKQKEGFLAVDTDLGEPAPQVNVVLDRTRLAQLGLNPKSVGVTLNTLVGGAKITTFYDGDKSYDVYARLLPEQRDDASMLRFLPVGKGPKGEIVNLESVAELSSDFGPSSVKRMERQFQVTVEANLEKSLPLAEANKVAAKTLKELSPPAGYGTATTGNTKLLQQTAIGALQALILAICFMFMVLASQYEDLLDPLIILSTIPLSVPFALLSLIVAGMTLNLFSVLGMFLLFGVVKKNAILQIEQTNVLLARGLPLKQAILDANKERLRPILMTTFILIVAMLPVALAGPTGADRAPMAVVVIGGQSLCLLLTLLVVPVATSFAEDAKHFVQSRWGKKA